MFEQHQHGSGGRYGGEVVVRLLIGLLLTLVIFVVPFANPHASRPAASHSLAVRLLLAWAPALALLGISRLRVSAPAAASGLGLALAGGLATQLTTNPAWAALAGLAGAYLLLSIKVADQWEKCVVLRLGQFHALRGPGLFTIVPFIDRVAAVVDDRVRTTAVYAEAALTRDTVPVHVDAVIFWHVWDAGKAALEVDDYDGAVGVTGQTALLQAIGRHELRAMLSERQSLAGEVQEALEHKTTGWGVTVETVEIRDVRMPEGLEDALSRQAQAERERQARNTLGDAEVDIAAKFVEASAAYQGDPVALHLRAMNMLFEAIKEKGTMMVVPTGPWRRSGR